MTTVERALIESADDLRARIRELAATEPNPAVIAEAILHSLTAPEFRLVASVSLVDYVRKTVRDGAGTPAAQQQTYETATGARTVSPKVAAYRDWVARELGRSVCVDEGASEWKFLAECTAADLVSAAQIRHRKAALTTAEAEHLEGIAKALDHAGVATVAELPRETQEAVLKR